MGRSWAGALPLPLPPGARPSQGPYPSTHQDCCGRHGTFRRSIAFVPGSVSPRLDCNSKQGESSPAKFEENFVIYPPCVECGINVLFQALKAKLENLPILWLLPGIKMSCLVATGNFMSSSESGGSSGPPAWTRRATVTPPGQQRCVARWPGSGGRTPAFQRGGFSRPQGGRI